MKNHIHDNKDIQESLAQLKKWNRYILFEDNYSNMYENDSLKIYLY